MDAKCKICRRAGEKLFLKGERCFTPKCAMVKRPYAPGRLESERKHRSSTSEFGTQLREKQKVRNLYGINERQFSNYVKRAMAEKGKNITGHLFENLELRLDNAIYRLGFVSSRALARQFVSHGHAIVNGKKITVPSYSLRVGDAISFRDGSKLNKLYPIAMERAKNYTSPMWLNLNKETLSAEVMGKPKDIDTLFNLQSVIEFYSR